MKFNYDQFGQQYSGQRRTDPRIAALVNQTLGNAQTVLNVGAGAGSYEPADRYVIAVEPSITMRSQRKTPAVIGTADSLPFDDQAFDASMAMITIHHWPDIRQGLLEVKRVTRNTVVIMTVDPDKLDTFWNAEYFHEVIEVERRRYPPLDLVTNALGGNCDIIPVPIPIDCVDGFQEAYYARPEAFLNPEVRKAQSAWGFVEDHGPIVKRLADDLESGKWDEKYGHFRTQPEFVGALRLIVARFL